MPQLTDDPATPPDPAKPDQAQASLRAELLVELLKAQADLDEALGTMRRDGADTGLIAAGEQQRLALGVLQHRFAQGALSPGALREAIAASAASSARLVQQGQAWAAAHEAAELAAIQAASAEARQATEHFLDDFYEKRIFDPYLHFDTAADERDYREREAARQRAIQAALAEGTPEGDLRASRLALDQLKDAATYGADRSPDFESTYDQINRASARLATACQQSEVQSPETAAEKAPPPDQPVSKEVDPAALAALQQAGVLYADQGQQGHGVTAEIARALTLLRS